MEAAGAQLALTFDVDAESVWLAASPDYARRLTTLSEARYGVGRGLGRVLELLDRHGAAGTFYVPGATAERHPDAVRRILAAGHGIGHHGHNHLKSHRVDAETQREEIEKGARGTRRARRASRGLPLAGVGAHPRDTGASGRGRLQVGLGQA